MNINIIQYINQEGFWLLLSFVILLALSFKKIKTHLFSFLNKKIANTNKKIDTQEQLLFEIQELYQDLQNKAADIDKEIKKIKQDINEATKIRLEEEKNKLYFNLSLQTKQMEDDITHIINKKAEEILNNIIDAKAAIEQAEEKENFDKIYNKNIFKLLKSANLNKKKPTVHQETATDTRISL